MEEGGGEAGEKRGGGSRDACLARGLSAAEDGGFGLWRY